MAINQEYIDALCRVDNPTTLKNALKELWGELQAKCPEYRAVQTNDDFAGEFIEDIAEE